MYITVKHILESPFFKEAELIAGKKGIAKIIKRVSVADVKIHEDKEKEQLKLFCEGDFFITCLEQFLNDEGDEDLVRYFHTIINRKSCGIIIATDYKHIINDKIIELCNKENFPLIMFDKNIPHTEIMAIINRYILVDDLKFLRQNGMREIMFGNLTEQETLKILDRFSTEIDKLISVICFTGQMNYNITEMDFHIKVLNTPCDIVIELDNMFYYIASGDCEDKLLRHMAYIKNILTQYFNIFHIGTSAIYNKREIKNALFEAKDACKIARCLKCKELSFDSLSTYPLLISLENSFAARRLYDSFIETISQNTSSEHKDEILDTIRVYVVNKGDYKKTAEFLGQHENTIRYRINKVKFNLNLENDVISFNELISLFVKLEHVYGK